MVYSPRNVSAITGERPLRALLVALEPRLRVHQTLTLTPLLERPPPEGMFEVRIGITNPMTNLQGRRALVTGASRGIGAEIVRRLAADGATVAFTYGRSAAEAEKLVDEVAANGGKAVAIQADSADPDEVKRSVDETVAALGGLDILVNNAGVASFGDVESFPMEEFDRMVAINVRAMFAAIQRAVPHLGTDGRIINIGSINADRVPGPGLSVYAMTKGGRRRADPWVGP